MDGLFEIAYTKAERSLEFGVAQGDHLEQFQQVRDCCHGSGPTMGSFHDVMHRRYRVSCYRTSGPSRCYRLQEQRRVPDPRLAGEKAVETENGILLTPYDPTIEAGLAIAARAAKRYRHALRELAK